MKIKTTDIPGLLIIEPRVHGDSRGFFYEAFQAARYAEHGVDLPFVQDNISRSQQHVLRGLHHQYNHTQGKLVWITSGRVFDVIVDIRRGSPSFGKWVGVTLDAENISQVYVPPGCAHGFCVLSEHADFIYKCTDYYDHSSEISIAWNDPDIGIEWPTTDNLILSEKDKNAPRLCDIPPEKLPQYQDKK
jgi:dTDP-4-dehydrorhamnose 3,5-epimerase